MRCGCGRGAALNSDAVKVVVVDDDAFLANELIELLGEYGLEAYHAPNWTEAVAQIKSLFPDIIILDQRLGRVDTLTRLPQIQQLTEAHIIMLTANEAEADRIVALELGADVFLVKPVSGREIVARIRACLRRKDAAVPVSKPVAQWRVSVRERSLYKPDGQRCHLTGTEFDLFLLLYQSAGTPVCRQEISRRILRREYQEGDRSIDSLIFMIRKRLGRHGAADCIEAVRNQGYLFAGFPDTA